MTCYGGIEAGGAPSARGGDVHCLKMNKVNPVKKVNTVKVMADFAIRNFQRAVTTAILIRTVWLIEEFCKHFQSKVKEFLKFYLTDLGF